MPILLPSVVGCTTFCPIVNVVVAPYMLNVSEAKLKGHGRVYRSAAGLDIQSVVGE